MIDYTFDRLSEYDAKRACLDKKTFESKNQARDHAARVWKKLGKDQHPYKCLVCHLWHVTCSPPQDKSRLKAILRDRRNP